MLTMRTYLQLSQALQTRRLCSWRGLEVASSRICSSSITFFLDWTIAEGSSPLAIVGVGEGEKMRRNRNHSAREKCRAYYQTTMTQFTGTEHVETYPNPLVEPPQY